MLALLQFDSAALPLLEQMLAKGDLPTLAALRRRGRWDTLDAKATFLQSSTYMTLCTGVDVREHGIYSAIPWSAADQRPRHMYTFPGPPTIWERLTTCGRRSLVVDPILAWAPRRMQGVYLSGWQFADRMVAREHSLPPSACRTLTRRHGRPPRLDDVYGTRQRASLLAWREHLVNAPTRAADAALDCLRAESFDLIWVNFSAVHKAGHHLWDPAAVIGESLTDVDQRLLQNGLAEVYAATDAAMARVLDALPSSADVIVFSPTGMAANTSRAELLPDMLHAVLSGPKAASKPAHNARAPIWAIRSAIPTQWRAWLARALPDAIAADIATRLYMRLDWGRTLAAAVPGENKGYVRINLKGRERDGIVHASQVAALLDTISRGLSTFHDPDGLPSIAGVERMSEMASSGSCLSGLPDLVVHWPERPPTGVTRVTSPVHGEVVRRGVGSGRSGNHVDDAWALLVPGPSRVRDIGRPARITDIGATACALLGADVSGLSGTSLLEAAG